MKRKQAFDDQLSRFAFDPKRDKVVTGLKDHSNDPYILKKNEQARKTLEKVGFPPQLLKAQAEKKRG